MLSTREAKTLVLENTPGRLSPEAIRKAREKMQALKFHPRDSLPNATALARAEALYVELTGTEREELGHSLAHFRAALDSQD